MEPWNAVESSTSYGSTTRGNAPGQFVARRFPGIAESSALLLGTNVKPDLETIKRGLRTPSASFSSKMIFFFFFFLGKLWEESEWRVVFLLLCIILDRGEFRIQGKRTNFFHSKIAKCRFFHPLFSLRFLILGKIKVAIYFSLFVFLLDLWIQEIFQNCKISFLLSSFRKIMEKLIFLSFCIPIGSLNSGDFPKLQNVFFPFSFFFKIFDFRKIVEKLKYFCLFVFLLDLWIQKKHRFFPFQNCNLKNQHLA